MCIHVAKLLCLFVSWFVDIHLCDCGLLVGGMGMPIAAHRAFCRDLLLGEV